jgi:cytochrome P450
MGTAPRVEFDPFAPAVQRDPYPYYEEMRRSAPVVHLESRGMWAASRHGDVSYALKRPDLFSSAIMADRELPADQALLSSDPPAHTALRKRVERSFTPARLRDLQSRLSALAADLTRTLSSRGGGDVVASLAAPLPVITIAELMGIDPDRHGDFKRWADAVIVRGTGRPLPADLGELDATVAEFKAFLRDAIESRRRSPGHDLMSALVRDDGGDSLSPAQVLNFSVLLLLGGSETATNLIGNALRALFANPRELVRARADRGLVVTVVEETLRYDAPVQSVMRRTTRDVELGGQRLPGGAVALLLLGSANRDEEVFLDADRFWLDRKETRSLAFGSGPHHCLGAALARMEARAALEALLALPDLRLAEDDVTFVDSFVLRGPRALHVTFDA